MYKTFQDAGIAGSDVNLLHRLAKNQLSQRTGWRAYAMFTEQGLSHFAAPLEGLVEQVETYEHLGDVHTFSMDLHGRYDELMDARRIFIPRDEAHFIFEFDYDAPPAVVWDWFNDPIQRGKWMTSEILPILRIRGRSGAVGARNHCVHGDKQVVVEDILDIKPFEYVTVRHAPQGAKVAMEITFASILRVKIKQTHDVVQRSYAIHARMVQETILPLHCPHKVVLFMEIRVYQRPGQKPSEGE